MKDRKTNPPTVDLAEKKKGHDNRFLALMVGAWGVVFGDIGTSPLYAIKQAFAGGQAVEQAYLFGMISLVFWSMVGLLCLKYALFIMQNDNEGEGGSMALTALVVSKLPQKSKFRHWAVAVGMCATALFFGDGAITPAISVLSAVEGLEVASPDFKPYVMPLALCIITGLFWMQKKGTDQVGKLFGPAMVLWFLALGAMGLPHVWEHPEILKALSPVWGWSWLFEHKLGSVAILSVVTLSVTGCEALYADMGHFGRKPIIAGWYTLVFPCLILNYMGQAAMLLEHPGNASNPFFEMAPEWALYPLVALSTLATVIASQAVISGVFSVCKQCVALGLLPRMGVEHTSNHEIGQIFIPAANMLLYLSVVAIVVLFKNSDSLAAAYGLAVTGTMILDTLLAASAFRLSKGWSWPALAAFCLYFLPIDAAFMGSNVGKIHEGGWLPLALGAFFFAVMSTWKKGREILRDRAQKNALSLSNFIDTIKLDMPDRTEGCAIFLHSVEDAVPPTLLHNLKHNGVIHEQVIVLTVKIERKPFVSEDERFRAKPMGEGFYKAVVTFGFREATDIPRALKKHAKAKGLVYDAFSASYFLNRESLAFAGPKSKMGWGGLRSKIYLLLAKNASNASEHFRLPPNQVVEMGERVEI